MALFAEQTDILFTFHNWPQWGKEEVSAFLTNQRDLYKWMHDQAMRLANHGAVPTEISEQLSLPEEFLANDHTRGYYGDLVHNASGLSALSQLVRRQSCQSSQAATGRSRCPIR